MKKPAPSTFALSVLALLLAFISSAYASTDASELARAAIRDRGMLVGKTVLTRLDRFSATKAIAVFYRYNDDAAILVAIDLEQKSISSVTVHRHMPTSLASEELADAEKLARDNPVVAGILAREAAGAKIEVDALVPRTIDPESPYYHHRVVRLHFRIGRTYLLYGPTVDVDLHTGRVYVQKVDSGHK